MSKRIVFLFGLFIAILLSCGNGGGGADIAIEDTSFSIGYNANGAESGSAPIAQSGNASSPQVVQANTGSLAKNGYLFDGWNTSSDGSGTDYTPGLSYSGKDITLYAKWTAIFNYIVINPGSPAPSLYGAQRASGNPTISIMGLTARGMSLTDITIPKTIDGYTVSSIGNNAFNGCTNVINILIPDTVINIGDSAFNGCSNLYNLTMQGTVPPALGTDAFAGCVLLAVSVPQSAASTYAANPGWSTVAILTPGTFSIIYDGNGSDGGVIPARQVGMTGITINVYGNNGSLTRAGCTFNGWNTKSDGTGNSFDANAPYAGPDNITLYAQWYHADYVVSFDGNGANTQASPSTIKVTAPANTIGALPSTLPRKNGYYFIGWNTRPDGTGDTFIAGSQVINDMTVYAQWNENNCTISYDGNNATRGNVPESHATQFNKTITLRSNMGNLEKDNYRFVGWNTKADGSGTDYAVGASYTATGDAILYAKWISNSCTITYNRNGSTSGSAPADQIGDYNCNITLKTNTGNLKRTCYTFGGWNTEADGSGTTYVAGTSYKLTSDVTLYAKWDSIFSSTVGFREGVAIGDIVLSNRATITPTNYTAHISEIASIGLSAIGVIAYEGGQYVGRTGNWYMLGLNQGNSLCWAPNLGERTGYLTEFVTSGLAGEDNWGVITKKDTAGTATAELQAINYPAFNYANTYSANGYTSGWFLPSVIELQMICSGKLEQSGTERRDLLNISIAAITNTGGTATALPTSNTLFWTSSQQTFYEQNAYYIRFSTGARGGDPKPKTYNVRVVRTLD